MATLKTFCMFALIAVTYAVADKTENAISESSGLKLRLGILKDNCDAAANALQNITIKGPDCEERLDAIANNYLLGIHYALYSLNIVIPNLPVGETQKSLVSISQRLSRLGDELQQVMYTGGEALKIKLASSLTDIKSGIVHFEEEIKEPNQFTYNQLKKVTNLLIYAVYKLKVEFINFDKTNKALGVEYPHALTRMAETLKKFSLDDKYAEIELRQLMEHLAVLSERAVHKFQNWLEVNPSDIESAATVREVSVVLSEIYDKLHRAATGHHTASYLKQQLAAIYDKGTLSIQKLTEIEYPDHLGGEELIRSVIIDAITISMVYTEYLNSLPTKA